jgi:5-formyltetrahydrofolate cyclo-ligase
MRSAKVYLRKKSFLIRKRKYLSAKKFNYNLIFKLIRKHFNRKKITIAGYYPSNYEVNILKFLKQAKRYNFKIVLPVLKSSSIMHFKKWVFRNPLYVNRFGMLEPKNSKSNIVPDLVLVPLLSFDNKLNRIGYGKGYYDRALKKISNIKKKSIFVGIAFSFQKVAKVPISRHDVKLDYIFTERGIISSNY